MEVIFIEKRSFAVIGKEGQGLATEGRKWIPPLWQAANGNFGEISNLAKKDGNGQLAGIWGAMSDVEMKFERWSESGRYLAGCEVNDEEVAPEGWTKWIVPSYRYAVVKCTPISQSEVFSSILNEYLPQNRYNIVGAVHEYYAPNAINGELNLYFPIEKISDESIVSA